MNKKKPKDSLKSYIMMSLLFVFGILLLYCYFLINNSSDIKYYYELASKDPSGFRFLIFLGIMKIGILITGLIFIITTTTLFIIKLVKKPQSLTQ
jgi:uncharacterized membrane protein SpoIIM required for sporulation